MCSLFKHIVFTLKMNVFLYRFHPLFLFFFCIYLFLSAFDWLEVFYLFKMENDEKILYFQKTWFKQKKKYLKKLKFIYILLKRNKKLIIELIFIFKIEINYILNMQRNKLLKIKKMNCLKNCFTYLFWSYR